MEPSEVYLDNNATTQPLPEVRAAVSEALGEAFGNPSSIHAAGERTRQQLNKARSLLASLLGCEPSKVIFTSGATEANNTILGSFSGPGRRIVTTVVEHSSIVQALARTALEGTDVVFLPVDRNGMVDLDHLRKEIAKKTDLVSIQWVNSETGVIQAVEEVGRLCFEAGVPFHTDAAQAVGKLPVKLEALPIDYASVAGHKFHSPQGVGAIYLRDRTHLSGLMAGGDQESGLRAGTENVPGIVGMGCAAGIRKTSLNETITQLRHLRNLFEREVIAVCDGVSVNGGCHDRVCNTSSLLFEEVDGEALVVRLDQRCSLSSRPSGTATARPNASTSFWTICRRTRPKRFGNGVGSIESPSSSPLPTPPG